MPRPFDPPTTGTTFGQRIRNHRLALGISAKKLAGQTGCSPATIRNWERGLTKPALPWAGPIARGLGIPLAALFTDELVVAEIVISKETIARIRSEGRTASQDAAQRLAAQLEPAIWAAVTRPPADTRPGARPKRRRTRAETLAELNARTKAKRQRARRSVE